jgi:hypothetical protein
LTQSGAVLKRAACFRKISFDAQSLKKFYT